MEHTALISGDFKRKSTKESDFGGAYAFSAILASEGWKVYTQIDSDLTPEYYLFNAPEAEYIKLAEALKARGTKIVYFGETDKKSERLMEALSLCDKVIDDPYIWKKAILFHQYIGEPKEYNDSEIAHILEVISR